MVYGNTETTTGGNALKFYASVRLDIRKIGVVTNGEQVVGNRARVKVVKTLATPAPDERRGSCAADAERRGPLL